MMTKFLPLFLILAFCLLSLTEAKTYECEPQEREVKCCPDTYEPVCAHNPKIRTIIAPCPKFEQYKNRCEACKNPAVDYFYNGECESFY